MFDVLHNRYQDLITNKEIQWLEYIGRGSSGKVYKAIWNSNAVICKCFHLNNYLSENGLMEDVMNEVDIYQKLQNTKHCCELFGISTRSEEVYLIIKDYQVMGDLHDYLNQSKYWLNISEKAKKLDKNDYKYNYKKNKWLYRCNRKLKIKITKQMCIAVQELHSKNIVHCDIKPNNFLYNAKKNKIILIDFGASYHLDDEYFDYIDENMGTMGYSCFELSDGYCCKKSDIYPLAICILEVWCGSIWKDSDTHKDCRKEVLSSLRYLKKKEPRLEKILRSCIVLDVDKRPYIHTLKKNIYEIF